jgi:hypothetical protein
MPYTRPWHTLPDDADCLGTSLLGVMLTFGKIFTSSVFITATDWDFLGSATLRWSQWCVVFRLDLSYVRRLSNHLVNTLNEIPAEGGLWTSSPRFDSRKIACNAWGMRPPCGSVLIQSIQRYKVLYMYSSCTVPSAAAAQELFSDAARTKCVVVVYSMLYLLHPHKMWAGFIIYCFRRW